MFGMSVVTNMDTTWGWVLIFDQVLLPKPPQPSHSDTLNGPKNNSNTPATFETLRDTNKWSVQKGTNTLRSFHVQWSKSWSLNGHIFPLQRIYFLSGNNFGVCTTKYTNFGKELISLEIMKSF